MAGRTEWQVNNFVKFPDMLEPEVPDMWFGSLRGDMMSLQNPTTGKKYPARLAHTFDFCLWDEMGWVDQCPGKNRTLKQMLTADSKEGRLVV